MAERLGSWGSDCCPCMPGRGWPNGDLLACCAGSDVAVDGFGYTTARFCASDGGSAAASPTPARPSPASWCAPAPCEGAPSEARGSEPRGSKPLRSTCLDSEATISPFLSLIVTTFVSRLTMIVLWMLMKIKLFGGGTT
jgi:hypothetical protein